MSGMKFKNYLLKIASPDMDRGKNEHIYLHGVSVIFKEIYLEIKSRVKLGKFTKLIYSELKSPKGTVDSWLSDHNPIPILKFYKMLKLWKKICKKTKYEFNKKWNEIFQKVNEFSAWASPKVILPKELNEEIAYLCGFIVGDGYVKDEFELIEKGKSPEYSICMYDASLRFSQFLESLFLKNFNANVKIYFSKDKKGSWYTTRCSLKPIYRFFTQVLNLQTGDTTGNAQVPEIIKSASDEIKIAFISGFFDAEVGVGITKKGYWMDLSQVSNSGLQPIILLWIKKFLKKFKIDLHGPFPMKHKNAWKLRCSNKKDISRFYNLISSKHINKILLYEEIKSRLK